ncbi:carboxylesterase [Tessaracoccus bendigoensis DSM 12906]|uniref:Carboxylesterase n=1 Tax=Tessaracoccus bendigoensis DSM 12906 TaxID=1123357 RepID=A0A1M6ATE3_9ACTN|nr:alpha/beta fold hydrolase [Tessaracoccus bendigoensis]SHI39578.1 carboxylesterase [Tessaracoccus bendigoensis DSM 12906]
MTVSSLSRAPEIWPEARTLRVGTGTVGVVMSHGFTGSVQSIAPWAHALAEPSADWPGARVIAPRLPGHGTTWRDLSRTRWWDWYAAVEDAYLELADEVEHLFVAGLSMGGALALRLAEQRSVTGVLLVNPAIATRDKRVAPASLIHRVLPPQKGISSDIAREGVEELGYPRFSVTSLATMTQLWRDVRSSLKSVSAPVLLMCSREDHVVDDLSGQLIRRSVRDVRTVDLERSYHVATLDHDAGLIASKSRDFVKELSQ